VWRLAARKAYFRGYSLQRGESHRYGLKPLPPKE
jgi:hypothetical protein